MHFGSRDFARTIRGQLWARRARRRRRVLAQIPGSPEGKKTATSESTARFQAELDNQMRLFGRRRAFTVHVALQIDFSAPAPDPPDAHTLAKHYLDVLQHPEPASGITRRRVLLKDDRLVRVLICNYHLDASFGTGVHLRAATLTDFVRDMELYRRIGRGDFADADRLRDRHDWRERDEHQDEGKLDDAWDDYNRHVARRREFEARFSPESYEALRVELQRRLQELLLRRREPRPEDLAALYAPHVGRGGPDGALGGVLLATAQMLKEFFSYALVSVELGAPAVREGESAAFKTAVRAALEDLRKEQPLMFPLLTTMGITVLYLPPADEHGQGIDLDNLARRVVPFVHHELRPPSDIVHALNIEKMTGEPRRYFEAQRERLKRTPKHHVTRYQVLQLPRDAGDPPEGSVRLMLHGGDGYWGPWDEAESVLSRWEDEARRELDGRW